MQAGTASASVSEKRLITAVKANSAPQLDGVLDDPIWQTAQEFSGFSLITEGNKPAQYPTFVRCLFDANNLYMSFRCVQPTADLKASKQQDGMVWADDCIELFFTPHIATTLLQTRFPAEQHFHLVFNSAGTRFDELGNGGPASWDGEWEVKTTVQSGEWTAEVKVPFSTLYHQNQSPPPFTNWNIQIGRSAGNENATFFPTHGLYRLHTGFGFLVFVEKAQDASTILWNLDRQNTLAPGLARLRETLKQMAATRQVPANVQKIKAQQRVILQLEQSFEKTPQAQYSKTVQAGFHERLAKSEQAVRGLQEAMVIQEIGRKTPSGVALAPHPATKDELLVKPDFLPVVGNIGKPIQVAVTPGEYRAASFVMWTRDTKSKVMVRVGALKSASQAKPLPADAVDVRWVKCWYQSGLNDIVREGNFLVPELLLKNPSLVKVDYKAQKNITLITPGMREREYPSDAATLQPLPEIAARTSNQVWLTVRVPQNTLPGLYKGMIEVQSSGKKLAQLPLEIKVLDYELAPSLIEHNWYTRSLWGISSSGQTPERSLAEAKNLAQHGVTNIGLLEHQETFLKAAAIMKKGGLSMDKLYIVGETGNALFTTDMTPTAAKAQAEKWMQLAKQVGAKELYLYLQDEARGDVLKAERPIAEAIRQAGAKTWVACYPDYFPLAGDFIDAPVLSGGLAGPELINKIHAAGHKVFSYGNPQGGVEKPEIYRRNYGLKLWQHDYDGAFDFVYFAAFGPKIAEYNPWDDFLSPYWRQHCMVYPTKDGVVDTIQWEGWREGVNDCRYLATLIREIDQAKKAGRNHTAVGKAEAWVKELKSGGDAALGDLDGVRAVMMNISPPVDLHIERVYKFQITPGGTIVL